MSQLEKKAQITISNVINTFRKSKSTVDLNTFEGLKNIFLLLENHKMHELGLGDNGSLIELQKQLIELLFHSLFCQNTYNTFTKSDLYKKSASELLLSKQNTNNENINTFNTKIQKKETFSIHPIQNSNSNLGINLQNEKKNLYEVCSDLGLYILMKLCETEDDEVNYEISSIVLQAFVKHTRMHFHGAQGSFCLQSVLAIQKLLQNSKHLISIAKDKDLINFLFGIIPYLFKDESKSVAERITGNQNINLNSLIIGQGFQGQQNQQQMQVQQIGQGNQSGKSSVLTHSNNPQQVQSPHSQSNRRREEKKIDPALIKKKLSFNRAISEPPSANKNAVVPVQEDFNDEENSIDYEQKGGGEVIDQLDRRTLTRHDGATNDRQVPPLILNQVQSQQPQLNHQNSSSIMNNYFNMPLAQFNTTIVNQQNNNSRGFKLNFIPQNTIAKSRLTRRQMSMSRKHTQKFSSVSNFAQAAYGDDTSQNKEKVNDYNSQERVVENKSSQFKKQPLIPKLNINSIIYDNVNQMQKIETMGLQTASHAAQLTNNNKSSNRSNNYSNHNFENQLAVAQSRMSNNAILNYQTNANVVRQNNPGNESDHNISMYDEVNGSFIDDMGMADGQTGYLYDNAEEKLRQLAIQLGEACLTNDLAALISQKREFELVKSARKTATSSKNLLGHLDFHKSRTQHQKPIQRSISVSYSYEPLFKNSKRQNQDFSSFMKQEVSRVSEFERQRTGQSNLILQRVRLVILNIVNQLLKKYDMSEARFLKHPISALNAYISSEKFKDKKKQKELRYLEEGFIFGDENDDYSTINSIEDNYKVTIMNNGKIYPNKKYHQQIKSQLSEQNVLQQITEVQQSDTEELKEPDYSQFKSFSSSSNLHGVTIGGDFENHLFHKATLNADERLNHFITSHQCFRQTLSQEETVIFKIYRKFTFVNEDILRKQVLNELSSFAAKDKGIEAKFFNTLTSAKFNPNNSFAQGLIAVNNLMSQQNQFQPPPISGTPIKQLNGNNLSFEEVDEDFYFRKERIADAIQSISNPNLFWSNNGIGFDMNSTSGSSKSTSSIVSKERIRKKLDVFLYSIDRRIKYTLQQYYDKSTMDFAKSLKKELMAMNSYLEENSSRIMLFQIIEVNLESLLMIKKCLIEIALKRDIFVMDFSKQMSGDYIIPSGNLVKSPNSHQHMQYMKSSLLIKNQKKYRELYAEYLRLISNILQMTQTSETMKLLNEVLIFDEQWQESVKTYSISLFLSDIVSTIEINDRSFTQQISLTIEELRGINIINFDEPLFIGQIMQTQNIELYQQTKKSVYHLIQCSQNVMKFFKSVMVFYSKAIQLYFQNYQTNQKSKYPPNSNNDVEISNKDLIGKMGQPDKKLDKGGIGTIGDKVMSQTEIQNKEQQKYWKSVIRRILYQYMYLITPPNGLLSQYLQNNAINYVNMGPSQGNRQAFGGSPKKRHDISQSDDYMHTFRQGNCPLNFNLTKSILGFLRMIFDMSDKFTKYVFIEELMLFYIRTHYISFVRLYNKNFTKKEIIAPNSKEASLLLCKKHLECLFAIAKNRNEDTRRKLYQFKIVQFLCQEIELEFDLQQRRQRFIQLSKEEKNKLEVEVEIQQMDDTEQSQKNQKMILIKHQTELLTSQNSFQQQQTVKSIEKEQQQERQPQKGLGILGMKKLNLAGLGAPSLYANGGDTNQPPNPNDISVINMGKDDKIAVQIGDAPQPIKQNLDLNNESKQKYSQNINEEDKVQNINEQPPQQPVKKLPFAMPKLKIAGLGLSELSAGGGNGQSQIEIDQLRLAQDEKLKQEEERKRQLEEEKKRQEEEDKNQNQVQQPPVKKLPFAMPKLKIAGLGLSELSNGGNQQSQIEIDQLRLAQEEKQRQEEEKKKQREEEERRQQVQVQQPPPKKLPFQMPKLKIDGLGLSELSNGGNQQSQIEIDQLKLAQEEQKKQIQEKERLAEEQRILNKQKEEEEQQRKHEEEKQKDQAPPQQPKKLPFAMPKLNITGLTLSELVQDKQDQQQQQQNEQAPPSQQQPIIKKPTIPNLNIKGLGLSEIIPDNSQSQHEEVKQPVIQEQKPQEKKKPFIPGLKVAGLGLSDLVPDKEEKKQSNQEFETINPNQTSNNQTIDYANIGGKEELFQKQDTQFDKTAPLKQFNGGEVQVQQQRNQLNTVAKSQQFGAEEDYGRGGLLKSPIQNSHLQESQESAQFLVNKNHIILDIPEKELGEKQKQILDRNRKNLLPPRRKSNNQNSDYNDEGVLFEKKNGAATEDSAIRENQMIISGNYNLRQSNMIVESVIDINSNIQSPANQRNLAMRQERNMSQPPIGSKQELNLPINPLLGTSNFTQTPQNQSGRSSSQGSFVGRNKVFIPQLKFPDDINMDPSEKIKVFDKPPDNARFRLQKTKEPGQTLQTSEMARIESVPSNNSVLKSKPGGFGKKGKLLNINPSGGTVGDGSVGSSTNNNKSSISDNVKGLQFNFDMQKIEEEALSKQNTAKIDLEQQQTAKSSKPNEEVKQQMEDQLSYKAVQQKHSELNIGGKKPFIPALRIPEKGEQPEGKEKIQQQIELSQQLNENSNAGNLTKLEQSLVHNNGKFQLLIDQKAQIQQQTIQIDTMAKESPKKQAKIVQQESQQIQMSEQAFYLKERYQRPIYQDDDLHVLMLSMIFCLLLKPERGILDDLYCSQYPIDNGKQNLLFILHHHLNHSENENVIQKILSKVQEIHPPLAGQRLLKLLCQSLFDLGLYNNGKDWRKIAEGAYAKVYESQSNLSEPQTVAIKQMMVPSSIYDRCVLHDIFTEITCLEELRLEPCVSDLYDYGVDNTCYYIVMRRYSCSLKEWRLKQSKSLIENLSLYLSIYREFLKALLTIHQHNVTHYDIKCDNVFLDFGGSSQSQNTLSNQWADQEEDKIKITIGDFGECKIFSNEKDELCQRNRGTDYCKSPEMLQLTINTRKDTDKYDRRKQVGTNRLSDVWSAGCLFFELLTGEYLFYTPDYLQFHFRVTRASEALITPDKIEKISNNIYLVDFLKYMLVRDPRLRPSIENVLKRFEHVHALLVSTSSANSRYSLVIPGGGSSNQNNKGQTGFEQLLEQAQDIMIQNSPVYGGPIKEETLTKANGQDDDNNISEIQGINGIGDKNIMISSVEPFVMKIMEDTFLSNVQWIKRNSMRAVKIGITHLVIEEKFCTSSMRDQFEVLQIPDSQEISAAVGGMSSGSVNPFLVMPVVMDFMRKIALHKGRVCFVESDLESAQTMGVQRATIGGLIRQKLIRECLIICLNHIYQTNAYETYTLIKSQNLLFKISSERLATISKWSLLSSKINHYLSTFPRFQCHCGQNVIILKRQFANYSNMHTINCTCCQYYKNIETSQCPSPGCNEFIQYMKTYFKTTLDNLHWGFLEEEDFVLGPNYTGSLQSNTLQSRMIVANMSQTVDKNTNVVSVIEKRNANAAGVRGAGLKDPIDYNMMSKSSATAKNYQFGYARWKLFKCKECHVWTHALNETENKYAILLNNRMKDLKNVNIRTLNSKQEGINKGVVRVPILQNIKMQLPF